VYQWCADLQIPSPRNSASVGFVEKWVRANDVYCTCPRRTRLQLHGLFLGGTLSARASQALIRGPFASAEKTADPSPRSTAPPQSAGHWRIHNVGLVSSDGPCRFFKIDNIPVSLTKNRVFNPGPIFSILGLGIGDF